MSSSESEVRSGGGGGTGESGSDKKTARPFRDGPSCSCRWVGAQGAADNTRLNMKLKLVVWLKVAPPSVEVYE